MADWRPRDLSRITPTRASQVAATLNARQVAPRSDVSIGGRAKPRSFAVRAGELAGGTLTADNMLPVASPISLRLSSLARLCPGRREVR